MIDLELVRHTYEKMTDAELAEFAVKDAVGLTPSAFEILKQEIRRRGLDTWLFDSVEAQSRSYSPQEIDSFCEVIRGLPCPVTGKSDQRLNATLTVEVKSFFILTQITQKIVIASPRALTQANDVAISNSLLLGLWGFPWGPIRTIQAVIVNSRNKKNAKKEEPSEHLRSYVSANIGQILMMKGDKDKLYQLLKMNKANS
ncbi:MAG: hypothetical protein ABW007_12270 [Chitinophagaceae bacterium]